jgi:hypothetical protein
MPKVQVLTEVQGCVHEVMLTEHVPSEMFGEMIEKNETGDLGGRRHGLVDPQAMPILASSKTSSRPATVITTIQNR